MKYIVASSLLFISAVSSAAINTSPVVVDEPVISVRAGEQDNGVAKVDQTITNVTRGVAGNFAGGGFVPTSRSFSAAPGAPAGAPSAFSTTNTPGITPLLTLPIPDPVTPVPPIIPIIPVTPSLPNPVTPVLPPIPEPETYALMAVGLAGLLLRKKRKV